MELKFPHLSIQEKEKEIKRRRSNPCGPDADRKKDKKNEINRRLQGKGS